MRELVGDLKGVQQVNRLRTTGLWSQSTSYVLSRFIRLQKWTEKNIFKLQRLNQTFIENRINCQLFSLNPNWSWIETELLRIKFAKPKSDLNLKK